MAGETDELFVTVVNLSSSGTSLPRTLGSSSQGVVGRHGDVVTATSIRTRTARNHRDDRYSAANQRGR